MSTVVRKESQHVTLKVKLSQGGKRLSGEALVVNGRIKNASIGLNVSFEEWCRTKPAIKALLKFLRAIEKELTFPNA